VPRFEKKEVKPNTFKIRKDDEMWVRDGNGRALRLNDEDRADGIVEELERRVGELDQ